MTDFDLLVTSGVGPAEARRFVFQLASHLERLAHARGLEVRDVAVHGDDRAPRSATLALSGDRTLLADEHGTHLLVQRSRGRDARKRWYAAVTLRDASPAIAAAPLARDELVITACRAGGPGGQHVNKVASAVRVHHVPSGLSIRCAAARSQHANLDHALRRLAALLHERAVAARATEHASRRDTHYQLVRGRPVRTYTVDRDGLLVETPP